jgi:hypothetical protein
VVSFGDPCLLRYRKVSALVHAFDVAKFQCERTIFMHKDDVSCAHTKRCMQQSSRLSLLLPDEVRSVTVNVWVGVCLTWRYTGPRRYEYSAKYCLIQALPPYSRLSFLRNADLIHCQWTTPPYRPQRHPKTITRSTHARNTTSIH